MFNNTSLSLENENAVLTINWDIGEHSLTAITGYSAYESDTYVDPDASPLPILTALRAEEFDQVSQEIRIVSPAEGTFTYLAGIYYEGNDLELNVNQISNIGPRGLGAGGSSFVRTYDQNAETFGAFAASTWHLSDTLRATIGLRYTEVQKDALQDLTVFTITGGPAPPPLIGAQAARGIVQHAFDVSETYDDFNPSINLQWDASDSSMLYLSLSQGFKAGGFDPLLQSNNLDAFSYDSEEVDSVELGAKMMLLDDNLQLNFALFWSEYTDLQANVFDDVTASFITRNAASSTSQGLEVDGRWAMNDYLTLNFSLSILDAQYDRFTGAGCSVFEEIDFAASGGTGVCTSDLAGEPRASSPEYSGNLGLSADYPLTEGLNFIGNVSLNFEDDFIATPSTDPRFQQDGYVKVDVRLGIEAAEGDWSVAVVGRNLTDEEVAHSLGQATLAGGAMFGILDRPRTIGIQGRYNF